MFKIGELIVYGTEGVCRVEGIGTPDAPYIDKTKQYYLLKSLTNIGTIYIPVDTDKFMRPVIDKETAVQLIDQIPLMEDELLDDLSVQELSERYRSLLNSHSCGDLIHMVRMIYHKKRRAVEKGRKPSTADERAMKRAEDLLHDELSVALDLDKDKVKLYIEKRVKESEQGSLDAPIERI